MSWLRRIFGGNGAEDGREPPRPDWLPATQSGPIYGRGEKPLERAKPQLLELLRERGAKSAVIAYDGGHDEGWITELAYASSELQGDPAEWVEPDAAASTSIDVDSAYEDFESAEGQLLEAAEAVVCDKWDTFAGEFEVKGRLLVDVASGRIVRRDSISIEEGPFEPEVEAF